MDIIRAFVTGATGFIGSYLVRKLLDQNVEVAILLRSTSNTWRIENILHKTEIIKGDLRMLDEIHYQIKASVGMIRILPYPGL